MSENKIAIGQIYAVTDVSEPDRIRYVGLTTRGVKTRASGHWTDSRTSTYPFSHFLRKRLDRREDVRFEVIDEAYDMDELNEKEMAWIAHFRELGQADLNLTDGGGGVKGRKMSDAEKEIRSQAMIGVFRGDKHGGEVKLSWEKVRAIRSQAAEQWRPHYEIAKDYGVSTDLISGVIRNSRWRDEDYDASLAMKRPPETRANNRQIPYSVVVEIRELRQREWIPETEIAKMFNLTRSNVHNILSNARWVDPEYDPASVVPAGGNGRGSKMTEADVIQIRKRAASGETQASIARDFGIKQTQVSRIVRGTRWGHVKEGL